MQQNVARWTEPAERRKHRAPSEHSRRAEPRSSAADRFASFFDRHYALALAYAYRRVRDRDLAEEIVERAFFHALRAFQKSNRRDSPSAAWVYRIVTNEIRRHYRSIRAYRVAIQRWADGKQRQDPRQSSTADQELPDFEQISVALERIGEKYAAVIALRYFEQLSTSEIAGILGA